MALPLVSLSVFTKKAIRAERAAITNIVISAVASLMYGEMEAPTVPAILIHP